LLAGSDMTICGKTAFQPDPPYQSRLRGGFFVERN
jgi:hypothetical protein